MVMAAVSAPVAVGLKWPWMVQLAPDATEVPQLFPNTKEEAFVPVTAMLVIVRVTPPVLVNVTDCEELDVPTGSLPKDKLVAESETAAGLTPVPVRVIDCGDPAALSVMVMAAVSAPKTVGLKWPWMVQLAPDATEAPQLFPNAKEDAFVPVTAMLEMVRVAPPVLVNVTDCEALDVPTGSLPKDKLVAESETAAGLTPVPVRVIDCGDPAPLSVMVMAAVSAPAAVGSKWPWMVQLAPDATEAPQLFPNAKEDAFVPVTAMLEMVRVAPPVFVRVTDCEALEVPTGSLPKVKLVADSDTAGAAMPVPLNATECGDPLALSVMETAAVSAPAAVGAKCPWIVQFAPAARLVPQLLPNANEDAFVPVTATLEMVSVPLPMFVRVIDCDALVAPTTVDGKVSEVGETETTGIALTVNDTVFVVSTLPALSTLQYLTV
jgi:hypothetical protein